MSVGLHTRMWVVVLSIASLITAGSFLVALPLTSPDNNDGTALKMYSDASGTIELPKSNGVYALETGKTIYLQIVGVSDDSLMSSGNTQNGETEVFIHYSRDGKNYGILFLQVMFQNGNSELVKWVVGDFDADGIFNPSDPDDSAIVCGTSGIVMYGKVRSTGMKDFSIAANTTPDFSGCPITNSSDNNSSTTDGNSDTTTDIGSGSNTGNDSTGSTDGSGSNFGNNNSGNNGSGNNNSNNSSDKGKSGSNSGNNSGIGGSHGNKGNGSKNNNDNNFCASGSVHGNISIRDEIGVYIENCDLRGNVKIKQSVVEFVKGWIRGNIKFDDSELSVTDSKINGNVHFNDDESAYLTIENSQIRGNIHIKDPKNGQLIIKNSKINGNIHVEDISLTLIDSVINGNLHCKNVDYSNSGSTVKENTHGCLFDEEHDDDNDD